MQVISALLNNFTGDYTPFTVEKDEKIPSSYFGSWAGQSQRSKDSENEDNGEHGLLIRKDELLHGGIDKAQFGKYRLVVHTVQELYGLNTAGILLSSLSRFTVFLQTSGASGNPYLPYALTVSGVAYLFRLKSIYDYASYSVFPPNQIIMYNTQSHPPRGTITAITATAGCLVIGRNDGSITCFQLGILEPGGPGFVHELRDDAGFGRLWGLGSRFSFALPYFSSFQDTYSIKACPFLLHSIVI